MAQSQVALRAWAVLQCQDIRAARCNGFFPLTPALSLGERVNRSLRGEQSTTLGLPLRDARCSLSLRERVRVRGTARPAIPRIGPFPEMSNWASPPAEPEVSLDYYDALPTHNQSQILVVVHCTTTQILDVP